MEKITEKTYIVLTDLAKLRALTTILNDVVPSINEFIDPDEYKMVREAIRRWERKLENAFETSGEAEQGRQKEFDE